jgi:hypothetical protein
MNRWIYILIFAFASTPAVSDQYRVAVAEGNILYLNEHSAKWQIVRPGIVMSPGTLVQFEAGSKLIANGTNAGKVVLPTFSYTATEPTVTRVDPANIRAMGLGGYFVNLSEDTASQTFQGGAETSAIAKAWERFVAVFDSMPSKDHKPEDEMLAARTTAGEEGADTDIGEITIRWPKPGSTLFVDKMPTEIAAAWDLVDTKSAYVVVLWEDAQGKPVPVAKTRNDNSRIKITKSGRYYVRVETVDGKWRSSSHLFIISSASDLEEEVSEGE